MQGKVPELLGQLKGALAIDLFRYKGFPVTIMLVNGLELMIERRMQFQIIN